MADKKSQSTFIDKSGNVRFWFVREDLRFIHLAREGAISAELQKELMAHRRWVVAGSKGVQRTLIAVDAIGRHSRY